MLEDAVYSPDVTPRNFFLFLYLKSLLETEWNSFTHLFPFLSWFSAYLVGFDMTSLSNRVPITEPLHVLSQHFGGDVTRIFQNVLTPPFFCFSDQL
jgi:hypothetical protein